MRLLFNFIIIISIIMIIDYYYTASSCRLWMPHNNVCHSVLGSLFHAAILSELRTLPIFYGCLIQQEMVSVLQ
jgi:hypothetical protein